MCFQPFRVEVIRLIQANESGDIFNIGSDVCERVEADRGTFLKRLA